MEDGRIHELLHTAVEEQMADQRALREALEAIVTRLDAIEARLTALEDAPKLQLETVTGAIDRRISDLGRMIVRDLGSLPHLLEGHRDTIVRSIRGESGSPPPVVDLLVDDATGARPEAEPAGSVTVEAGRSPRRRRRG
jgi:hypothetical protein